MPMKEHPIIFTTENVKAILEGRKTQTRRIVSKHNSIIGEGGDWSKLCWDGSEIHKDTCGRIGHPIEFNRAPLPFVDDSFNLHYVHVPYNWQEDETIFRVYSRYEVGDRLWVRETFWHPPIYRKDISIVTYKANMEPHQAERQIWKASMFMPRWASRILLEITEVRVQRVQDITEEDIKAEGVDQWEAHTVIPTMGKLFCNLWDTINKARGYSWASNPWCWCITFRRM